MKGGKVDKVERNVGRGSRRNRGEEEEGKQLRLEEMRRKEAR